MTWWDWITLAHDYLFCLCYKAYGDREVQAEYENALDELNAAMKEEDIIKCVMTISKVFGSKKE